VTNHSRRQADLLAVQDEIATEILDKIRPRLSGEEKKGDEAAHRGLRAPIGSTSGPFQRNKARRQSSNAIDISARQRWINARSPTPVSPTRPDARLDGRGVATEAKAAAERALKLDPNLAEAHVALGHIKARLDCGG
jgi:hypothetical protein